MKIKEVSNQIVNNYRKLKDSVVTPQPERKGNLVIWGLNYKKDNRDGFVSQNGFIRSEKIKIQIIDGAVQKLKKPFWTTWNKALQKINYMLQDINKNKKNTDIVKQRNLELLCFSPKQLKIIQKTR